MGTLSVSVDSKDHLIFSQEPLTSTESRRYTESSKGTKSSSPLVLHIKPESNQRRENDCLGDLDGTEGSFHGSREDDEYEWRFTVGSGSDHPISPLTASHPAARGFRLNNNDSSPSEDTEEATSQSPTPESVTCATSSQEPEVQQSSSPNQERSTEKWVAPPPTPRPPRPEYHRSSQPRQPLGRLQISRLLKQRSFNFPFHISGSSGSSSPTSPSGHNGSIPAGRASVDGSPMRTGTPRSNHPTRGAASCDIPRPIGPPDPIPPHYQHLQARQNRRSTSFRRRSHGDELERFAPGWIVTERSSSGSNSVSGSNSPRTSVHGEQTDRRHSSRRHLSLGHQSSMWGRLLTSIFPSERSEGTDGESGSNRDSMDGAEDLAAQQRLLFSHSNQHQSVHPLFQQQLFFYADEIPDMARVESEHIRHEGNEDGARHASTSDPAVETSRESVEMIGSCESISRRPSTPNVNGTEGNMAATRPSESVAKISVSSLALSSPPSYWEAAVKYQGWPTIDPRPEQGQESLPRYTCTVFREGCVNRKTELVGNWRPYRRPWK